MSIRSTGRAPERGLLVHTFSTQTKLCDDRDGTAFPISFQSFRKSPPLLPASPARFAPQPLQRLLWD